MIEKIDLETAIYRILSNEEGPSQNELSEKLEEYAKRLKKIDLILKVDSGNLSKKLKSLEKDKIIFHTRKKLKDRDQEAFSYYITRDLAAFERIIRHLARNIDTALEVSPLNTKDWKKSFEIKDDKPRNLTLGTKCGLMDALIKSSYVRNLIGTCGFALIYKIYKKEVDGYCDINEFIVLAKSLVHEGSINDLDEFGQEFVSDAESWKRVHEAIDSAFSKKRSNP